ncbi:hypothetical protein HDF15_000960 [Granulicella mallensis]|jgi:hypothetical protein|uniref:Uncharacterized protein n=1 Tax=Granulicella mallensis TaxID=940614 RepID=A0A7W8E9R2_9BACT|nr:hypothetical protein [Granulicella mallensis]
MLHLNPGIRRVFCTQIPEQNCGKEMGWVRFGIQIPDKL